MALRVGGGTIVSKSIRTDDCDGGERERGSVAFLRSISILLRGGINHLRKTMTRRDCVSKEVHEADYGRGCIAILSPFFNNPRRGKQKHRGIFIKNK